MSGGSFDYAFGRVDDFAVKLAEKIAANDTPSEYGFAYNYSPETLAILRDIQRRAEVLANLMYHAEWLYSGDIGEDTFRDRVRKNEK